MMSSEIVTFAYDIAGAIFVWEHIWKVHILLFPIITAIFTYEYTQIRNEKSKKTILKDELFIKKYGNAISSNHAAVSIRLRNHPVIQNHDRRGFL